MTTAYAIKIRDKQSGETSYHGRLLFSTRARADEVVTTWAGPKHDPISVDLLDVPGVCTTASR